MRDERRLFEWVVMRHLDAAYNLARWYMRNEHDAEDVVQDSMIKAYQAFPRFEGIDGKPWLLKIVRNGCVRQLERQGRYPVETFDDEGTTGASMGGHTDPEALFFQNLTNERVRHAIEAMPGVYREVVVLREFEDLSYSEIAAIINIPAGTVMSRLSRARAYLAKHLHEDVMEEKP
ncbi:MAG: sigma-70 family RNA polymerase sigma factor [Fimbriimonas sp.]|nr:sigma-70 family RNA polymerase sigma factor [Fimbriimonas sp.]